MNINFSRTQQRGKNNIHIQLGNPWSRNELGVGGDAHVIGNGNTTGCNGVSWEQTLVVRVHTHLHINGNYTVVFLGNIKHTPAWQHSQDDGEAREAPTSGTWSKGAPKHSVMNRKSILIQYF